jgi:hypothetical protein
MDVSPDVAPGSLSLRAPAREWACRASCSLPRRALRSGNRSSWRIDGRGATRPDSPAGLASRAADDYRARPYLAVIDGGCYGAPP